MKKRNTEEGIIMFGNGTHGRNTVVPESQDSKESFWGASDPMQ